MEQPIISTDLESLIERIIVKTNSKKQKEDNDFVFWLIPSIFVLCVIGGFIVKMFGF